MKVIVKFAVYDDPSSQQKRTTYRIVQNNGLFSLQKYSHNLEEWIDPFVVCKEYKTLNELFQSQRFRNLFTPNE